MVRVNSGKRKAGVNQSSWQELLEKAITVADDITDKVRRGPLLSLLQELRCSLLKQVSGYPMGDSA